MLTFISHTFQANYIMQMSLKLETAFCRIFKYDPNFFARFQVYCAALTWASKLILRMYFSLFTLIY